MEEKGIEVDLEHSEKHSMFYYKGIPIENHKTFINSETYHIAVKMDKLLQERYNPYRRNWTENTPFSFHLPLLILYFSLFMPPSITHAAWRFIIFATGLAC